eukprot:gnl/TRDRNA2_/TRDRNA2_80818_c0_seq2.p1 gnl/TRDRNA2_/TRDRNA2_80818_c0~~gnl/TRDRNA2_/TRDRNA2_80818_c0_seq2.p1  ORF type:complete len:382 (+),score=36.51 gnl/TRDRNA2_/TRDRNA2_80818_c0_seq2:48-1193(+)
MRCAKVCIAVVIIASIGGLIGYVNWLFKPIFPFPLSARTRSLGFDPAPEWFAHSLLALPRRHLNAYEIATLRKDGAVVVRDLVADQEILQELNTVGSDGRRYDPRKNHMVNGVLNALVRHGPLGSVVSSMFNHSAVAVWNMQYESRPSLAERKVPYPEKPWEDSIQETVTAGQHQVAMGVHNDVQGYEAALHTGGHFAIPLASLFLAITDVPHGLELLAGSHVENRKHRCIVSRTTGKLDPECMNRLERDCNGVRWWDLKAGDAILFYGETFHWTKLQQNSRLALSTRFIPADLMYTGLPRLPPRISQAPAKCTPYGGNPVYPIVFSNDSSTTSRGEIWPVWPRNTDVSPLMNRFRSWHSAILGDCKNTGRRVVGHEAEDL